MDLDIDLASLELIAELQLQDAHSALNGRQRQGGMTDFEVACTILQQEFDSLRCSYSDHSMCRSIARAVMADANAIQQHTAQECQASYDRQQALAIQRPNLPPQLTTIEKPVPVLDDELLDRLKASYVGVSDHASAATPESLAQGAISGKSEHEIRDRSCTGCMDDITYYDAVRCPCEHDYCRACLTNLFSAAIGDESLYPARCCGQAILVDRYQTVLPAEVVGQYKAKAAEYDTPNRTYCHEPTCSTFVPTQFIQDESATCVKCQKIICTVCKGPSHQDDCPQDTATMALLQVAALNGWQRCKSCKAMIELGTGCNHITCRCGAQFCYVCGVEWKRCTCAQWDEERLFHRANAIIDRDPNAARLHGVARRNQLARQRQNLVANHECTHQRWDKHNGQSQCEECHDTLPDYIYECRQCQIRACQRCRFNRL